MLLCLLAVAALVAALVPGARAPTAPDDGSSTSVPLDGRWSFALDPGGAPCTILVPGGGRDAATGPAGVKTDDNVDRSGYEIYGPNISHSFVVDKAVSRLQYNHGATVARFRDTLICLWNGNTCPKEGHGSQFIEASHSTDNGAH